MTEAEGPKAEVRRSPEIPSSRAAVALQMRLMLGKEALDYPIKPVADVKAEDLPDKIAVSRESTMKKISAAATVEEHEHWSSGDLAKLSQQEKVNKWVGDMVKEFSKEKYQTHRQLLNRLHLGGINFSEFSADTARAVYHRYFEDAAAGEVVKVGEDKQYIPAGIKKFIDDVVAGEALQNDLDKIKTFAKIFGKNSAEIIEQYLAGFIKTYQSEATRTEFVNQVNEKVKETARLNSLNEYEENLLAWLNQKSAIQVVQTLQPATPTPPSPQPPQPPEPLEQQTPKSTEEKPQVIIIEPPEVSDYSKLSKEERLHNLPGETLRSIHWFCDNLRKRIQDDGKEEPFKDAQGNDMLKIADLVTKKIYMNVAQREHVEDGWFNSLGFNEWATENGLPLAFYVTGPHAQLLLKIELRDGQLGFLRYDPSQGGEKWEPFKQQLTLDQYIEQEVGKGNLTDHIIKIDDEETHVYENKFGVQMNRNSLVENWLNEVLPSPIYPNREALRQLADGTYDLSLEDDPGLPEDIKYGKIQQAQFDAKNCIPISFFHAALRYAAKPGDNEFKRKGIKKFEEDFAVRILTREEILRP